MEVTLTEDNFEEEVLESETLVLVDLWAPWCGPCRMVAPILEELAEEFSGQVKVAKLNVDNHPAIAQRYEVRGIPTLIFFKEGKIADRLVGVQPKPVFKEKIEKLLSSGESS